jgi:hypothetical protein
MVNPVTTGCWRYAPPQAVIPSSMCVNRPTQEHSWGLSRSTTVVGGARTRFQAPLMLSAAGNRSAVLVYLHNTEEVAAACKTSTNLVRAVEGMHRGRVSSRLCSQSALIDSGDASKRSLEEKPLHRSGCEPTARCNGVRQHYLLQPRHLALRLLHSDDQNRIKIKANPA